VSDLQPTRARLRFPAALARLNTESREHRLAQIAALFRCPRCGQRHRLDGQGQLWAGRRVCLTGLDCTLDGPSR